MTPQPGKGVHPAAGNARGDPALVQPTPQVVVVVALVGMELGWPPTAGTAAGPDRRDGFDQRLQGLAVVGVGSGDGDGEGETSPVGQDVDLSAGLAPVHRVRPGQRTPFFARTLALSQIARDQSTCPPAPSSSRAARCSRRHRPTSVQATNRRCAVAGDTPNTGGRCRQAHPVVSTHTTAANTRRTSRSRVPPPCDRTRCDGISGCASSHNPPGTSSCTNPPTTPADHAQVSLQPHKTRSKEE